MSLATYDEAKAWAPAIRTEVLSGRMPPWSARPGFGDFVNDASLSNVEIELLAKWAEGGAPHGPDAAPAPRKPHAPDPERAERFSLPAVNVSGASTETVTLSTAFAGDRWISAWEFEPGARPLVETAVLSIGGTAVGTWTPFDGRISYTGGTGERLPKGADLTVAVHYRKPSEPQADRSALMVYFDRKRPRDLRHMAVTCGSRALDDDMTIVAVTPHAASAGDTIEIAAYRPNATVEPVCVVSPYRPEYPVQYRFRSPLKLERGSRLEVRSSESGCNATIDYVTR